MSEVIRMEDGISYGPIMEGFRQAVSNYRAAFREVDPDVLRNETGPTREEQQEFERFNTDVIVPDALTLTEDAALIRTSPIFKKTNADGYVEEQYVFDVSVGKAVARNLFAVTNSAEIRELLPDHAVALFEVNANRGFPRGREDSAGCYGISQGFLDHVVIDTYYLGSRALASYKEQDRRIDYLGEPGSWTTFGKGLERNAARIRIRSSYPLVQDSYSPPSPRNAFLVHSNREPERGSPYIPREPWAVLRGGYRICRAVAVLHDLTDWQDTDFQTAMDIIRRTNT